ncbi:peroxisomal and mitochondrial division factor 2-like [Salvia hispanica]|uniref:peroxisomal and mitochondrial division factor 2-like n=1 Tax=Salvia hispanica TaxID=49212 RepID=UPI002009A9DD|nr:peroxisomal and mitochondrial division factor 2-like [Salvia hispanica]
MADEPSFHEEFADADNADSYEIAELNQRINDLEEENTKIVKEYKQQTDELKASIQKLESENADLKNQTENAQSDNKAFGAVAARAADLEGEVSRLHHDLATAMIDLQELPGLKSELEGVKGRAMEKDVKLDAAEREKALLVVELDARDKQIQVFKKNVEELEAVVGKGKGSAEKDGLAMKVEKMKAEISVLQSCLDDKEVLIKELERGGINGDDSLGNRGLICGLRQREWMLVGGSAIATAAVMVGYIHAARKH